MADPIQPRNPGKAYCGKDPKMKKLLIKSTIAAFAIEIIGAAANLISYTVNGRFLLAKQQFHCFLIVNKVKLRHSPGRPSRSDFVQSYFPDVVSGPSRFRLYLDQF